MKLHPLIKLILLFFTITLTLTLTACTYTTKLGDKFLPDAEYNTLVVQANAAMHDGEWAKAAVLYEKAGQLKPDNWDLKLKQAQAYRNDGKLSQAYNVYQVIIDAKAKTNNTNDIILKTAKEGQAKLGFKNEPVIALQAHELANPAAPELASTQEQDVAQETPSQESPPQVIEPQQAQSVPPAQTIVQPESNQSKLVMDEVTAWAKAWADKNIEGYFAHYVDNFAGELGSPSAWRQSRKDKISKAKQIKISFSDIQINNISAELAEVTFKQQYQSGTYQDSGKKTLAFKKMNGDWRITQETFK